MDKDALFYEFMYNDFSSIAHAIASFLNNPIVIINNTYRIIEYTKDMHVDDQIWLNATKRGYITLEFGNILDNFDSLRDNGENYLEVTSISKYKRRFYKISRKNQVLGYLNVLEYNHMLDDISSDDYDYVVALLAKELSINQNVNSNQLEAIMHDLSDEQYFDYRDYQVAIKGTYFETIQDYVVIFVDLGNELSYNADRDNLRDDIIKLFPHAVITVGNGKLKIIVPAKEFSITNKLLHLLNAYHFKLGISEVFANLYDYKIYERQANIALRYQGLLLSKKNYVFYDDIKSFDLINHTKNIDSYINGEIMKIYDYDLNNHTEYILTLYTYMSLKHSITATGDYLFLHRNTVNYRIKSIKELFNVELDNPDMISEYLLGCKIILCNKL